MSELLTSEPVSNPELFTLHASAVAHERQGEATEAAFMAKASNLGFAVAKPIASHFGSWHLIGAFIEGTNNGRAEAAVLPRTLQAYFLAQAARSKAMP